MSLESAISEARSELSRLRAENSRMQSEINQMENSLQRAMNQVNSAKSGAIGALKTGVTVLTNDDGTLHNVSAVGKDIEHKMVLYKNVENAYKTIRGLNNDLRYHQGNEKTVRRMVTAILDNEEKTFASEETLRTQIEKLHLETKDYFLSYVMMELQLRKSGETAAADRALAQAEKMNARKTAWVEYMIALRRNNDADKAKWLDKIIKKPLIGAEKEFLKMLVLISLSKTDEESKKIMSYTGMDKLQSIDKDEVVKNILSKYMQAMTVKPPEFKKIDKHVGESENLGAALYGAMNNENVVAFVQKLSANNEDKMRRDIVVKMLDDVVETCHSPKAQEIYDKIAYQEKIIEAKGVMENAMALKAVEDVTGAADIDLEACMYEWLNTVEKYNGKRELNEFSYEKYRPSYKRAYKKYVAAYQSMYTESVNVTIEEYKTRTKLEDMTQESDNIEKFCKKRCETEKAAIKDTKFILLMVFGGLLLVAGIVLNFISQVPMVVAILAMVAGVVLLIMGAITKYGNYKRKIAADERCARDIVLYRDTMHDVFDEMQNYREMYKQYNAKIAPDSAF